MSGGSPLTLRSAPTEELSDLELTELRMLLHLAFDGRFDSTDWDHTVGGQHFMGIRDDEIVAHAAVVARRLFNGEQAIATGYVEGVAVADEHRHNGYGLAVMEQLGEYLTPRYELGALSAAEELHSFYGRLGWRVWPGPTAVMADGAVQPTPEEDGGVMILATPSSPEFDVEEALVCEWREGDVW